MKKLKKIQLDDTHLRRMVDDAGILRQSRFALPDRHGGYGTNDNARLAIMAAMYYEAGGGAQYLDLCCRALSFMQQAYKDGWFRKLMTYDRRFAAEEAGDEASQECYGRCMWALGYVASRRCLPQSLRAAAGELMREAFPSSEKVTLLRPCAYTVLGVSLWNPEGHRAMLAEHLARIAAHYHENVMPEWFWYESEVSYCNATIPHALLAGYQVIGGEQLLKIGLKSFNFLLDSTTRDGFFWPVGCHGWSVRGGEGPALYDQLPVEACGTILCCLKACEVSGDKNYLKKARLCLDWFMGHNSRAAQMIDPDTGGCYDSLREDGPSPNQGAESLLSWYVSVLAMKAHKDRAEEAEG